MADRPENISLASLHPSLRAELDVRVHTLTTKAYHHGRLTQSLDQDLRSAQQSYDNTVRTLRGVRDKLNTEVQFLRTLIRDVRIEMDDKVGQENFPEGYAKLERLKENVERMEKARKTLMEISLKGGF
jgi:uncharacterized coiled-coil DUF342 family protein